MSPVDEPSEPEAMFEFSCRSSLEPEVSGKTVSWGIPVSKAKVLSRFKVHDSKPLIQDSDLILRLGL
jgi:salicylate hydroxylase